LRSRISHAAPPAARRCGTAMLAVAGVAVVLAGCSLARETRTYRISSGETLLDVARKFKVGYVELVAANPDTDPWLPPRGKRVVIPRMHIPPRGETEGIVINVADMRLYYYASPHRPPRSYAIGIGREGLTTPLGHTTIVRKTKDPTWKPTPRMRKEDPTLPALMPAGPDNPMGTRALYLGWTPYAIHGSNKAWAVGRRISSGCVRMYNEDIEELFELAPIGTKVTVVDQPIKFGWIDGELYMEAHPTKKEQDRLQLGDKVEASVSPTVVAQAKTWAGSQAARVDLERVREVARERRGYPVRITR
jgi:L,D-transpeptidase ErfK/SrfK